MQGVISKLKIKNKELDLGKGYYMFSYIYMSNFQIYTINKPMLMWLWSGNTKFTTPLPLNFNKFQFCEYKAN